MSPRVAGRAEACGRREAQARLDQARAFLDVAKLVGEQDDDLATPNVAASLAVLAGIAASDAVCCAVLGRRPEVRITDRPSNCFDRSLVWAERWPVILVACWPSRTTRTTACFISAGNG